MKHLTILTLCTVFLAACQTAPSSEPAAKAGSRGTGYLDGGPTVALDSERPAGATTTLQRVGVLEAENADLKAHLEDLQSDLEKAKTAVTGLDRRLREDTKLLHARERELEAQVTTNKALQDDYLRARIAKARLEQELLQLQLANLIREER